MSLGEGHSKGNQRVLGKGIIRNYGGRQFQRRICRFRGAKAGIHSAKVAQKMPKLRFRKFSNTRWREGRADKAQKGHASAWKRRTGNEAVPLRERAQRRREATLLACGKRRFVKARPDWCFGRLAAGDAFRAQEALPGRAGSDGIATVFFAARLTPGIPAKERQEGPIPLSQP